MKKLDPTADGESVQLAVRLPPDLVAVLDAEAARMDALMPGQSFSRSHALRSILASYKPPGAAVAPPAVVPAVIVKPTPAAAPDPADLYRRAMRARDAGHTVASLAAGAGSSRSTVQSWLDKKGGRALGCAAALAAHLRSLGF